MWMIAEVIIVRSRTLELLASHLQERMIIFDGLTHYQTNDSPYFNLRRLTYALNIFPLMSSGWLSPVANVRQFHHLKIPKSCLKQMTTTKRQTNAATAESRALRQREHDEATDKISNFESFCNELPKRHKRYNIIHRDHDVFLSRTDEIGRKFIEFIHFRQVTSHFGFLHLVTAEKNGIEIPKSRFKLQKNS